MQGGHNKLNGCSVKYKLYTNECNEYLTPCVNMTLQWDNNFIDVTHKLQ